MTVLAAALAVAACETEYEEAELGEVPEVAEVEMEPEEIELEEAYPLTAEDLGDRLLVTGTVVGSVLPGGFFVASEGGLVLFVETDHVAIPGEMVSVTGVLEAAETTVFDEWEVDALEGEIEAEWDVIPLYYLDAGSVSSIGA